ncbi:hypothetical protein ACHWQZ_G004121 [Mnemiopsis leidyi]
MESSRPISPRQPGTLITFCLDIGQLLPRIQWLLLLPGRGWNHRISSETFALSSSPDHPSSYSHFVDDSCSAFRDKDHAETLNNAYDKTLDKIKSAPAHHSLTTGHRIARNDINILKTLPSMIQIPLGPD